MSTTSAISSSTATAEFLNPTARIPSQSLGQEDFLKLLVTQMTSQDPMNPMSNTDFVAQMAQFTSLQQTKDMSATITQLSQQQQLLQANEFIGREVSLLTDDGSVVQGVVGGIEMDGSNPLVVVDGEHYSLSSITSVALPGPLVVNAAAVANPPMIVPTPQPVTLSETQTP
jgi:flagellar basal-body rod modification protein FlgD